MNGLNIKNAIIAGLAGSLIFSILLLWKPLSESAPQESSVERPLAEDKYDRQALRGHITRKSTAANISVKNHPQHQMNPDALAQFCSANAEIELEVGSKEYDYILRRLVAVADDDKKEQIAATFEEFLTYSDAYCKDWKPAE